MAWRAIIGAIGAATNAAKKYQSATNKTSTTNTSSSKSSSSKNSSSGGGTTQPTNVSYNGDFISINPNTDYQAKINEAVSRGDYAAAARAEAERNAKLQYLGRGSEATSNYVNVYGSAPTNNQGGIVYTNKNNSFSDLPSNWTTANVGGQTYTKDNSGKIYELSGANTGGNTYSFVGDGINPNTGEFTFSNPQSARDVAYDKYIASGGNQNVSKEYALDKLIDGGYIDALLKGTANEYTTGVRAQAQANKEKELARQAALIEKYADFDNSFESEYDQELIPIPTVEEPTVSEVNPMEEYIRRQLNQGRMRVY